MFLNPGIQPMHTLTMTQPRVGPRPLTQPRPNYKPSCDQVATFQGMVQNCFIDFTIWILQTILQEIAKVCLRKRM